MKRLSLLMVLAAFFSFNVQAETMVNINEPSENYGYKESWITVNKSHQYLGLGALLLGSLTAILPKPEEKESGSDQVNYVDSLHYKLALGATYLGGAALGTGLVFHYKDISFKNLFRDPDNLHALLATVGTLGFLFAINAAPNESHVTPGVVGIAGMVTAIKITW